MDRVQDPFISVIVPVYKVEQFITRCLDSLLQQRFADFELLLIDDGSPDQSGAICDAYMAVDPRVQVFHISNQGVSHARNLGLAEAKGEWITFVDSDDYVDANYLLDFANSCTGMDLVYQGILTKTGDKLITTSLFEDIELNVSSLEPDVFLKNKIFHCGYPFGKLFRLDVIRRYNLCFNESIRLHEDHLFVFDYLSVIEKIKLLPLCHYYYCLQKAGESLSHRINPYKELLYASDAFLESYRVLENKYRLNKSGDYLLDLKYSFGVSQRVKALYSFYILEHPSVSESIAFLTDEFVIHKSLYQKYYRPHSLPGYVSKILFLNTSILLQDRLLRLIVTRFRKIINKKLSIA